MFHFILSFHRYSIDCPGMDLNLSNNVWFDDEEQTDPTMLDPEAEKMCTVSYKKEIEAEENVRYNLHEASNLEEDMYLLRI